MMRTFGFRKTLVAAAFAFGLVTAPEALAACSSPAGNEGDVIYSSTFHVMQYCNSTTWVSMGSNSTTSFGTLTTNDFCTATNSTGIQCTTGYTGSGNVVLSSSPSLISPTVSSGGQSITAGGLTVSAGGAAITGTVRAALAVIENRICRASSPCRRDCR